MNVLNCFPKLSQPKAKAAIHNIWQAETKVDAEKAFDLFIETYEPKYPKAALCLQKDREELMAFFDFPAQHWQNSRTSNPIESAFATIRHRTKRSKGCLSRDGMLHMMFKLGQCAEQNWRKLRGFDYLAKVITGVTFKDGIEATKPTSPHDPKSSNTRFDNNSKIERWHQTLKNRILLENYFLPGDLEAHIAAFVGHYNHQRYHESLNNVTPADVYTGRSHTILLEREKTKRRTMKLRRLQHAKSAA